MFQVTQYTNNIQFTMCSCAYHIVTHYKYIYIRFILYINTYRYMQYVRGKQGLGGMWGFSQSSIELSFEIDEINLGSTPKDFEIFVVFAYATIARLPLD